MKAVVFAGADITDYDYFKPYVHQAALIICCDSGMRHARRMQCRPHLIVGDFDSVDEETYAYFKSQEIPFITYSSKKDATDLVLGVNTAIERGATDITIIGGIGSRLDHTLANCHYLLNLYKRGIAARLVNEKNEVFVAQREVLLQGKAGDLVSVIPLSMTVKGVTTQGLEYPLEKADLSIDDNLIAVSNVMKGEKGKITMEEGYILVMKCRD